jgi:hypothetical protein
MLFCCNQCLTAAAMTVQVIILSMESRVEENFLSATASLFIDRILRLLNPHKLIINFCLRIQTELSNLLQSKPADPDQVDVEERGHETFTLLLSFHDKMSVVYSL